MRISVLKEREEGETRVAVTADIARRLVKAGHDVVVECGAGEAAASPDAAYEAVGARVAADAGGALENTQLVVGVQPPSPADVSRLPEGVTHVSFVYPETHVDLVRAFVERGVTAFAMDQVPRITRAQSMDALSSMSTAAGYRSALLAAHHLGRFFPMLMTAAGTIPPSRVVVIGAGVAGLQAIATCRRLGAVVEAYDIRAEAREQAKSLGAEAIEVALEEKGEGEGGYARKLSEEAEQKLAELLAARIRQADAVITTALVPGKPAPRLVSRETVESMKPGSVLVDLAAETGGNCELTQAGEAVHHGHVLLVGPVNLPATMPIDCSRMYAKNVEEVVRHLSAEDGGVKLDFEDEITAGAVVVHAGEVRHGPTKDALAASGDAS